MSENVKDLTDGEFQAEIVDAEKPAVIDFWASWCAPCRALAPVVDELAQQFDGQVKFTKMNVDDNPNTPSKFAVRSIPTLLFFKEGKVFNQIVGVRPKAELEKKIQEML